MSRKDRLPEFSPTDPENDIRAALRDRRTVPDLVFRAVGVAGFEPTTSSSRSKDHDCLAWTRSPLELGISSVVCSATSVGVHRDCHSVGHALGLTGAGR
jgi:hypothetical protein